MTELDERILSDDAGTLELWNPGVGVFGTRAVGRLSMRHAEAYIEFGNAVLSQGRAVGLNDWWDMEGYQPGVRQLVVKWSLQVISQWEAIHVLLESRLVKMGVSVANLALKGQVCVHNDRAAFDAIYSQFVSDRSVDSAG